MTIRAATPDDVPLILSLIAELAEYERAPESAVGTEELLATALFGTPPHAEAVIASVDGEPAGFALFFGTFSTWLSRPGIWLEDLFVRPPLRGSGVGRALLEYVASVAVERGCPRLEWTVLKWNTPAIGFYERLGAEAMDEWQTMRLSGAALGTVARRA
ncbi:MAG TPA: GNAT family N-acetyltransferase [Solirubrobacteraceae bacterium]|nr:GNAT family N-acetyltransferase [Solirubrobacteraceae bacterium]